MIMKSEESDETLHFKNLNHQQIFNVNGIIIPGVYNIKDFWDYWCKWSMTRLIIWEFSNYIAYK